MRGEIIFLAHRIPFPPDRGDKIRSHHILKALAQIAPVHVGCLAETAQDRAAEPELAALAASYCLVDRPASLALAGAKAMLLGQPVSEAAFWVQELRCWLERLTWGRPIAAIYVFSGQMGQYVPADWRGRLVVDLVDVDSAKFESFAASARRPMAWVHAREARLLRGVEGDLARRAAATLLVSEDEAALLRARGPSADWAGKVRALGNGVDSAGYDPAATNPQPEIAAQPGPHFVFSGQMDYAPNVAAVTRFAEAILPQIRAVHAMAAFHIVGRAPTPAVVRLGEAAGGQAGVRVWGAVSDMRPFLAAADFAVAPLSLARGVQNKVLEAMAMARPVLLSREAATGITAQDGTHFAICDDDAAFVRTALGLIGDSAGRSAMAAAAREFVVRQMSWAAMLADLPAIMGLGEQRDAA